MTNQTTDLFAALRYNVNLGTPAYRVADSGPKAIRLADNVGKVAWRSDTGEAIGLVGTAQTIVQPSVTISVFERLLESGHITDRNLKAFAWKNGAKQAIVAETGKTNVVRDGHGKLQEIIQRVFSYDSFDGSASWRFGSADYVFICTNGMVNITGGNNVRLRHTASIHDRFAAAVQALRAEFDSFEQQIPMLQKLADTRLNDRGFQAILDEWFPKDENGERSSRAQNQVEHVERLYHEGAGADPGSLWGAYQAATNWITHHRGRDGSREEQNLVGAGANLNRTILTDLVARAEQAAAL